MEAAQEAPKTWGADELAAAGNVEGQTCNGTARGAMGSTREPDASEQGRAEPHQQQDGSENHAQVQVPAASTPAIEVPAPAPAPLPSPKFQGRAASTQITVHRRLTRQTAGLNAAAVAAAVAAMDSESKHYATRSTRRFQAQSAGAAETGAANGLPPATQPADAQGQPTQGKRRGRRRKGDRQTQNGANPASEQQQQSAPGSPVHIQPSSPWQHQQPPPQEPVVGVCPHISLEGSLGRQHPQEHLNAEAFHTTNEQQAPAQASNKHPSDGHQEMLAQQATEARADPATRTASTQSPACQQLPISPRRAHQVNSPAAVAATASPPQCHPCTRSTPQAAGQTAHTHAGTSDAAIGATSPLVPESQLEAQPLDLSRSYGFESVADVLSVLHPATQRHAARVWVAPVYPLVDPPPNVQDVQAELRRVAGTRAVAGASAARTAQQPDDGTDPAAPALPEVQATQAQPYPCMEEPIFFTQA